VPAAERRQDLLHVGPEHGLGIGLADREDVGPLVAELPRRILAC